MAGKLAAYVVGIALLGAWIGWWAVLIGWMHQLLGLAFHVWF